MTKEVDSKIETPFVDKTESSHIDEQKPLHEKPPNPPTSLLQDIVQLLFKILIIIVAFILLFTFMFGIVRISDGAMEPAMKSGDLIIFYRLDKKYTASDVVVIKNEGKYQILRVVAVEGDTVDITDGRLSVNGSIQSEPDIYEDTNRYTEGIDFPVTLEEGQVFLLGDAREHATDSRIFGPVDIKDTLGKVSLFIRRRSL